LAGCGSGSGDVSGDQPGAPSPDFAQNSAKGLNLPQCFAPAKFTCNASGCFCKPPPAPPPAQHFTLTPDFFITNVIYAPPGKSSSINYSSSTSVGTTVSATSGVKDDVKVTAEASGSFFGGASVSVTGGAMFENSRSDAVDISQQWSQGYKKSGQVDRIDHNYDEIWFLIHPILDMTFQPAGTLATQTASLSWQFAPNQGADADIPQFVYAGWLNNTMQMPPNEKALLDSYQITPAEYGALLAADPLYEGVSPNQTMDPSRFDYIGEYPFEPPFSAGDQPSTQSYSVDQKTTNTMTTMSSYNYSVGLTVSASFNVGLFESKLSVADTWTWSNSSSLKESSGSGSTDTFVVGQPVSGYTGPTQLHVYEDKVYKTYAFTLDWPVPESDLALGRPSYQSSDPIGASASRANDGNTDGNFWDGSVNHTDFGFVSGEADWPGQYWFVDLGSEKSVDAINIFNRTDCCTERLSHYNVLAFDSSQGLWKVISNHSGDDTTGVSFFRWPVSLVKTEYVMIAKTDQNYLHLAEVQVMGF
jgi:hypothetical protein